MKPLQLKLSSLNTLLTLFTVFLHWNVTLAANVSVEQKFIPGLGPTFEKIFSTAVQFQPPANYTFQLDLKSHLNGVLDGFLSFREAQALHVPELRHPVVKTIIQQLQKQQHRQDFRSQLSQLTTSVQSLLTEPASCFPVTRRFVSAFLLLKYLDDPNWSKDETHNAIALAGELFALHRAGYRARKRTEFFHISKAGGTSVCQVGKKNGCTAQNFSTRRNCLIYAFYDGPRWTVPDALKSLGPSPWCARWGLKKPRFGCVRRDKFLKVHKINFYANEYVMHTPNGSYHNAGPCPNMNTFMSFREPQARMLSHMRQIIEVYTSEYTERFFSHFNPFMGKSWKKLAPAVIDNYVTRSLLGENTYMLPFGYLQPEYSQIAQSIVMQLDVVSVLETAQYHQFLFKMGLGWNESLLSAHARNGSKSKALKYSKVRKLSKSNVGSEFANNELDQKVYEFANVVQLLDLLIYSLNQLGYRLGFTKPQIEGSGTGCGFLKL